MIILGRLDGAANLEGFGGGIEGGEWKSSKQKTLNVEHWKKGTFWACFPTRNNIQRSIPPTRKSSRGSRAGGVSMRSVFLACAHFSRDELGAGGLVPHTTNHIGLRQCRLANRLLPGRMALCCIEVITMLKEARCLESNPK